MVKQSMFFRLETIETISMPCLCWSKNKIMLSLIATLLRKVDHFVAFALINLFPQEVQISTLSYSHLQFLNSYFEKIWHLQIAPFSELRDCYIGET